MKRFTETTKWADPWFQDLPPKFKLLWMYLVDNCDLAGIWKCNFRLVSFQIGDEFTPEEALEALSGRIQDLGQGRWWIQRFCEFQYGRLSTECKPHKAVIERLRQSGLPESGKPSQNCSDRVPIQYPKGMDTLQEKEKEKETDKEKEQDQVREKENGGNPDRNGNVGYTPLPAVTGIPATGSRKPSGVPATEAEAIEWAGMEAVPDDFAKEVFHKCEGVGWIDGVQRPITNFRSYIKHRWVTRQGEAAQGKTQPNGRPLSIMDLQQIVKIKEQRAAELRRKGSSEVATGIVWSDPKLKQEHFAIRTEIKELNARIEQFA